MSGSLPENPSADDDDVPWADPQIRLEYEAALGAFVLEFNHVDYAVGVLLELETARKKKAHLYDGSARFQARLQLLEAISASERYLEGISFEKIRELSKVRNILAHGHFSQNPFDGTYSIMARQKARDYPAAKLRDFARQLNDIVGELNQAYAFHAFDALDETH